MKTMKINLMFALAAVLAAAPLVSVSAAKASAKAAAKEEAKEEAKASDKETAKGKEKASAKAEAKEEKKDEAADTSAGPTPAQLKARKAKKPSYTKYFEAKTVAEKCGQPLIVALLPEGNPAVQFLKQKVMNRKEFLKDFALKNCVLLYFKIKIDSKDPKKIDTKQLKDSEVRFLENYAVSEKQIQQAKANSKPEPTYKDSNCYPAVICVDSTGQKELFRLGSYDREGGFGVWLSTVVDNFKSAGFEDLNISPLVNKILENPDDPKKWK